MSGITFGGLGSGLDTSAIIDAMVGAASIPLARLDNRKSDYNSQLSILSSLTSQVSSVRTAAKALDTTAEFREFSAGSSDEDVATATASSTAAQGNYVFEVQNLANAERTYSVNTYAAKDQTGLVGTGDLTLTVGTDPPVIVSIDQATDTLEGVASKINSSSADVTASVIYDGANYRLLVQGNDTGATNGITFAEGGSLNLNVTNQAQAATDATIVMDGITFNSDSNQVTDVVPGVTLDLQSTTEIAGAPGTYDTITVKVDIDSAAMEAKINTLLSAYNSVINTINGQNEVDPEAEDNNTDTLVGDSTIRTIKARLQSIVINEVSAVTGDYTALSRIGVKSNKDDGTLSLDSGDFAAALADDLDSVTDLFTYSDGDDTTENDGIAVTLERTLELFLQTPDGILPAKQDGLKDRIENISDRMEVVQRQVESLEARLVQQYAALEQSMASINRQGNFLAAQGGV
jgi:flagellar hook-associated protein 2